MDSQTDEASRPLASQVDALQDNSVFSAGGSSNSQDAAITTHNIQIAEMDRVSTETIVEYYTSLSPEESRACDRLEASYDWLADNEDLLAEGVIDSLSKAQAKFKLRSFIEVVEFDRLEMGFMIEEFLGQLSEIDVKYRLKNTALSVQDFSEIVQICQTNEQCHQ